MKLLQSLLEAYNNRNKEQDQKVLSEVVGFPVELLDMTFYDLSSSSHGFNPHLMISFNADDTKFNIYVNFLIDDIKWGTVEYKSFEQGGHLGDEPFDEESYPEDFKLQVNEVEVESDTNLSKDMERRLKSIFSDSKKVKDLIQRTDLIKNFQNQIL